MVALRAVQTSDFMTADWAELPYALLKKVSGRIINEVRGINRVTYDVSSCLLYTSHQTNPLPQRRPRRRRPFACWCGRGSG